MKSDKVLEYLKPYFKKQIEQISEEELKQILEIAYTAEMPILNPIPYFGVEEVVTYDYKELVALCPITTIQDLYRIIVEFVPNKYVCELKSLRFYYLAYRNLPISHELLLSKIKEEFSKAIKPKQLKVILEVATRGGIDTTVVSGRVEL